MKLKYIYLLLSIYTMIITAFTACMKAPPVMGIPETYPFIAVADLKALYKAADLPLQPENTKGTSKITGIVISDAAGKNIPEGMLVIQNDTTGISLFLGETTTIPYVPGDSLVIDFSAGTLVSNKGILQITGISPEHITRVGEGKVVTPLQLTIQALSADFARYECRLVKIAGADLLPVPAEGDTYSGVKDLYDGSAPAGAVKLYTATTATFANRQALANATFNGIAMWYNDAGNTNENAEKQLWLRNAADIENTSIPLQTDVIITGFLSDSRGSDGPVKGRVSGVVTHPGQYEYIQLMALRDIDFSQTPYAVVTCNNGAATTSGWAAGGSRTFKFNLTSGFAAKGTFFYVGGTAKVIAGYSASAGLSTDISNANWIRAIDYNDGTTTTVLGDDFGNSTGGLLGNSSPADGIAVFRGTTVTATSVPVDAVFYGSSVGTAYMVPNSGYLVPSSDIYNPVDPATGASQPLFGQGTNKFISDAPNTDVSSFTKLGGVVSQNAWIVPRKTTLADLPITATLDDIEKAVGTTYFRP